LALPGIPVNSAEFPGACRVTAGNTRKKFEQYFIADGISEPVILEVPKGKYIRRLVNRNLAQLAASPASSARRKFRPVCALVSMACSYIIVPCSTLDLLEKLEGRQIGPVEYLNPNQWMVDARLESNPALINELHGLGKANGSTEEKESAALGEHVSVKLIRRPLNYCLNRRTRSS
jgi:hypothetical protein